MRVRIFIFALLFYVLTGEGTVGRAESSETKQVVLLGASIGNAWDIKKLPSRIDAKGYTFEFIAEYNFDKSGPLNEILKRESKPYAVILKECSTYFPGNFDEQKRLVQQWTEALSKNGIVPILATAVPVTSPRPLTVTYLKNLMKRFFPMGKINVEGRQKYIVEYNDWIRRYAEEKGLAVLDLESALRRSEADRRLRPEFSSGDGVHLNRDAYALLDTIMIPALAKSEMSRARRTNIAFQ